MNQEKQWNVRAYRPGDESGILDLFKRVFGHERSIRHWRWKFLDNPAGQQISVATDKHGRIIGQFAGLPVVASTPNKTLLLTQGVDHMVDEHKRREGIYEAMARHFFETYLTPGGTVAWYAFPVRGGFEIERRAFRCSLLHEAPILAWNLFKPDDSRLSPRLTSRISIDHLERAGQSIDELWNRCRSELRLASVRDARYLNWRYTDSPDTKYTMLLATDSTTGRTAGLAVIRFGWSDQPVASIVDWLVPVNDLEASSLLLARCHELARNMGLTAVQASFPDYAPQYEFLVSLGYRAQRPRFVVSVRCAEDSEKAQILREGWYYTMGDTDMY